MEKLLKLVIVNEFFVVLNLHRAFFLDILVLLLHQLFVDFESSGVLKWALYYFQVEISPRIIFKPDMGFELSDTVNTHSRLWSALDAQVDEMGSFKIPPVGNVMFLQYDLL